MWNLNRPISEQVKNWNFFLLRQTAERSKLENSHQFRSSEYRAQVMWKVTPGSYQKELKIQWVDSLREAYSVAQQSGEPFF